MIRKFACLMLLALLSSAPTSLRAQGYEKIEGLRLEEYQVYDALIQQMFLDKPKESDLYGVEMIVIKKETSVGTVLNPGNVEIFLKRVRNGLHSSMETSGNFVARNERPHPLADLFQFPLRHVLVEEKDLKRTFDGKGKGWGAFYKKYPHAQGFLILSGVGFNDKKEQALVYLKNQDGTGPAEAYYSLLNKQGGKWAVVAQYPEEVFRFEEGLDQKAGSAKGDATGGGRERVEIRPIGKDEIKGTRGNAAGLRSPGPKRTEPDSKRS